LATISGLINNSWHSSPEFSGFADAPLPSWPCTRVAASFGWVIPPLVLANEEDETYDEGKLNQKRKVRMTMNFCRPLRSRPHRTADELTRRRCGSPSRSRVPVGASCRVRCSCLR
jgi:hypothetical protein